MMAWDTNTFKLNYDNLQAGYHGGNSSRGFFTISGTDAIDVDTENDFALAELAIESTSKSQSIQPPEPIYWDGTFTNDEVYNLKF